MPHITKILLPKSLKLPRWSETKFLKILSLSVNGTVDLPDLLTADFVNFLRYNGKTSKHADQTGDSIGQDILSNYTF